MAITMKDAFSRLGMSYDEDEMSAFNIPCPVCITEKPKNKLIHIEPTAYDGVGAFRCPRCEASGGPIHFYGLFKYGYSREAINNDDELREKLRNELKGQNQNISADSSQMARYNAPKRIDVDICSLVERDETYLAFLNMLNLSNNHWNDLVKRGLREEDILKNNYKSVPKLGFQKIPGELRKQACNLQGVPGFYKPEEVWFLQKTKTGYYIPYLSLEHSTNDLKQMIQVMQIRFDTVEKDEVRYKWFATPNMKMGCGAITVPHFRGFPEQTVIFTEGALKADIIYRFLNEPVIAIPGVNCLSQLHDLLSTLQRLGVKRIKTAFDMDYKKNPNVQSAYIKLVILLQEYGFAVERMIWDENYKGLDDYLLKLFIDRGGKLESTK